MTAAAAAVMPEIVYVPSTTLVVVDPEDAAPLTDRLSVHPAVIGVVPSSENSVPEIEMVMAYSSVG